MCKLRFGVIGLGRFGEIHCEALSQLPQIELHALCTRNETRLRELGDRFAVRNLYSNYHQLLESPDIDAVSIVTMWDQHAPPAIAALRAGKHAFIEKPMASTVADCEAIIQAAGETGRFCMVGHICRFNPRYAAAKREIDNGALGRIVSLYARRNIPAAVSETVLTKIGPIIGDGVHDTDLMLWFTGAKIQTAYAQTLSVRGLKYPDIGWTTYRFDTGAIGVCENVWFLPENTPYRIDERMEIIGTEGAIYIQETPASVSVCDRNGWRSPDSTYWPVLHGVRAGALRDELQYFAGCILEDRGPSISTLADSLEAVRACLAAERSSELGVPVSVE
jgi:UDP-N-acetylglucosamine 3-dehydrogenase